MYIPENRNPVNNTATSFIENETNSIKHLLTQK